ncbi:MAG: magnetochrome domain-containing protein [Pseudomonadota bacterium]
MKTKSWGNAGRVAGVVLLVGLIAWKLWLENVEVIPTRQIQGEVLGAMPKPTQPTLTDPLVEMVNPTLLHKMLIKRIPTIGPDAKMPHPSWGPCIRCHLIQGGAPAGSQPATPVAKVWEQVSAIYKVGPPILPNSIRPHPASGRCIKCHDILVYTQPQ